MRPLLPRTPELGLGHVAAPVREDPGSRTDASFSIGYIFR